MVYSYGKHWMLAKTKICFKFKEVNKTIGDDFKLKLKSYFQQICQPITLPINFQIDKYIFGKSGKLTNRW